VKIGGIFTAFNEGDEVRATVENWLAGMTNDGHLPIVVDDGATDGSCDSLAPIIRHAEPWGVGRSRNEGAAVALAAGCDVVVFHDAHMRFPAGVIEAIADKALDTDAIVTSMARGWWYGADHADVLAGKRKAGDSHPFRAWGADLHYNARDGLQPKYRIYVKDPPEWQRVPCPMGACYALSRRSVEMLQAPTGTLWDDVAGRWGFSEQALAVKAFLLNIPVFVSGNLATHHKYRSVNPVPAAGRELWLNAQGSLRRVLSAATFNLRFRQFSMERTGQDVTGEGKAIDAEREAMIWTHLMGRGAPITGPHECHQWFADLPRGITGRILQWRPGESTLKLRELNPGAEIVCLEWNQHRAIPWKALLSKVPGVHFRNVTPEQWTRPPVKGAFAAACVGGERQDECVQFARMRIAPDGVVAVNPTADKLIIEDAERRKENGVMPEAPPAVLEAPAAKVAAAPAKCAPGEPGDVTVILLNYARPENIGAVLESLTTQTARPRVWIWDNGEMPVLWKDVHGKLHGMGEHPHVERYIRSSVNMRCFPRWLMAGQAETEYIAVIDDDLRLADPDVLADAMEAQRTLCPDGVVGFFGWEQVEGKSYKASRHVHGSKVDRRVDAIKGRFMVMRRALLQRVPLAAEGAATTHEDDLYVSLSISGGARGAHLVPGVLGKRWREVGKQDSRALASAGSHYGDRDALARRLLK